MIPGTLPGAVSGKSGPKINGDKTPTSQDHRAVELNVHETRSLWHLFPTCACEPGDRREDMGTKDRKSLRVGGVLSPEGRRETWA